MPFQSKGQSFTESDSSRLQRYFTGISRHLKIDISRSRLYADSAENLCQSLNLESCSRRMQFHQGLIQRFSGESQKAIATFTDYRDWCHRVQNPLGVADAEFNIGHIANGVGESETSLAAYQRALAIFRGQKLRKREGETLDGMADVFQQLKQLEKAVELREEARAILEAIGDKEALGNCYNNLGNTYRQMKNYEKAELYYTKDYTLALETGDTYAMGYALHHLGRIYRLKKQYDKAEAMLLQSLVVRRKLEHKLEVVYSLNGLGQLYNDSKQHAKALPFGKEAVELCTAEKYRSQKANALSILSEAYHGMGKDKESLEILLKYNSLKDSLFNEETTKRVAEMDARFQASEKDKALAVSTLTLERRTHERNGLIAGAALLGLLALVVFYVFRYRMRLQKRLAVQESLLQQQQIKQLEQESRLHVMAALVEGQERERSRIAGDLHDSLGGLLAAIKSHFNAGLEKTASTDIAAKTNALIDNAAIEMRRIAHNMMPRALALSGLKGALEDLANDLNARGLPCDLELIGIETLQLDETRTVMLYRIVQELTHNAAKHSGATRLLVQIIQNEGRINLLVEDNGRGFDVDEARSKKGLGLESIESRLQYLKGEIVWDSEPGEATSVTVSFEV